MTDYSSPRVAPLTVILEGPALDAYNAHRRAEQALANTPEGPELEAKRQVHQQAALNLASWVNVAGAMAEAKEKMGDDWMKR